ncbi:MAG: FAD-dependent oxidoreductase [Anaerolineae bacterium]|nr:FAD-dependent oxidoreductase [Anaerolineae bacterium]
MQRNIAALSNQTFDVVVIGGGIAGACAAWDATLRGFRVALVEAGDFGHATSANSLKIIHGGLRYLQDGNLRRARSMARERQAFFTIAPHLIAPLPVVVPTTVGLKRHRWLMRAALAANDVISFGRNNPQTVRLPRGRLFSRTEWLALAPELNLSRIEATGGAMWVDGQMVNSERLTLSFILAAAAQGATVANYVAVTDFECSGERVTGVIVRDTLPNGSTQPFVIAGRTVINAAGYSLHHLLPGTGAYGVGLDIQPSVALNLVVARRFADVALALPTQPPSGQPSRLLFITPWRSGSIIGTAHVPFKAHDGPGLATTAQIEAFIAEVNTALPGVALTNDDIQHVHQGILPAWKNRDAAAGTIRLVREGRIIDHAQHGMDGLLTMLSVKYTAARLLAEQAIDGVSRHLNAGQPCQTRTTSITGYGMPAALTSAEMTRYAVRREMAQTVADVVLRRTDIGTDGIPAADTVNEIVTVMAEELGWDEARQRAELVEFNSYCKTTVDQIPE